MCTCACLISSVIRIELTSFLTFDFLFSTLRLVSSVGHFLVPRNPLVMQFDFLSFVERLEIVSPPNYSFVVEPNISHLSFHPERIAR